MGAIISEMYQSSAKIEEISDDEFLDAEDQIEVTDNMFAFSEYQEHLITDAIQSKHSHSHLNTSKITFKDVEDIEQKLHFYEKISLIFLLMDQVDYALQASLIEWDNVKQGTSINVLSQWARSKHTSSSTWQDKFVEALCVIQNYAIIRELGFCPEDLKEHYLPSQPYTTIHLDLIRKALYCLCEQLSNDDTKKLLKNLATDFKNKSLKFENYGEKYLELYLLHSFSVKYITNTNISNLISVLKQSGFMQNVEMLETVSNYTPRKTITKDVNIIKKSSSEINNKKNCEFDLTTTTENYSKPTQIICSVNSVIGDNSIVKQVSSTSIYDMDPENVGICLIINQKKFHKPQQQNVTLANMKFLEIPKNDLQERHGTDLDKEALSNTFQKFGFRILTFDNQNHDSICQKIETTMQMFTEKDSCFIVCILSHGVENKIYGADSIPVSIDEIVETLHNRKYKFLLGKPKVLFIQSCQGSDLQKVFIPKINNGNTTDGPSNNEKFNVIHDFSGIPEKRDLLIGMSTIAGYASIRNESVGSWYIQELCKAIDENCEEEHLTDILTIVNNRITAKCCKIDNRIVSMVPEARTILNKMLFFKNLRKSST